MKSNKQNGKDRFKEFQKKNSLEWWFETLLKIITTQDMRKKRKPRGTLIMQTLPSQNKKPPLYF